MSDSELDRAKVKNEHTFPSSLTREKLIDVSTYKSYMLDIIRIIKKNTS